MAQCEHKHTQDVVVETRTPANELDKNQTRIHYHTICQDCGRKLADFWR